MSKVTVMAVNGKAINPSAGNPEFGFVRVEQVATSFENGWARSKTLSALINGKISDLEKAGFRAGQEISGKIVTIESLTPTNPKNLEQDLKVAGETGIVCKVNGSPIYVKKMFTTDLNATDVRIAHTNGAEIKAKQAEMKAQSAL